MRKLRIIYQNIQNMQSRVLVINIQDVYLSFISLIVSIKI